MNNDGLGPIMIIIWLVVAVFYIIVWWKLFTKAGRPGWAVLIPIYNLIVFIQIAGKPGWWILLYLIPIVNLVIYILIALGLAEKFGKGTGFAIGIIFLSFIFIPILALGSAKYKGA